MAIGFWPCAARCADEDVTDVLGDVVYRGPYSPQLLAPSAPPYQNFTVTVPEALSGRTEVSLNVAHLALVGVSARVVRTGSVVMLTSFGRRAILGRSDAAHGRREHYADCFPLRCRLEASRRHSDTDTDIVICNCGPHMVVGLYILGDRSGRLYAHEVSDYLWRTLGRSRFTARCYVIWFSCVFHQLTRLGA